MTSKDEQLRIAVAEQAVDWFLERHEKPLDPGQAAALMAWYRSSPINVEEFLGVAAIARDLHEAGADPEHSVEALVERARADDAGVEPLWPRAFAAVRRIRFERWQPSAIAIAALAIASVGLLILWNLRSAPPEVNSASAMALHFATHHGEQQTYQLADGSVLHLNTDTAVTVQYSNTQRQVVLRSGQVGLEIVHDPKHPFQLFAGSAEVIDLGTTFDVRLTGETTLVTVVAGRVAVGLSATSAGGNGSSSQRPPVQWVDLGPDQQISLSREAWPATPTGIDAKRTTAWMHRQIAFNHEPLEKVAAEFNRYAAKPVEIATPELRKLEITGVFSTEDTDEFVSFLRTLDGVRVDVTATQIRVSRK